jgi:hypothetical protein
VGVSASRESKPNDRVKVLVTTIVADIYGSPDRFELYVRPEHAEISKIIQIKYPDGTLEDWTVVGICQPRRDR